MNYVNEWYTASEKHADNRVAVNISKICWGTIFLSLVGTLVGMFLFETIWSPGPTIPIPTGDPPASWLRKDRTTPENSVRRTVNLYVYPKDAVPLGRTLELDVIRHGGWTIANYNHREMTFAVSEPYLRRLQALIDDSGTRPVGAAYRRWAFDTVSNPEPKLRNAKPDLTINVVLRLPFLTNPATIWTAVIAGIIVGAAAVILVTSVAVNEVTK